MELEACINFGKADKVELLEKFAISWMNLAILQGQGRNIAFKLLRLQKFSYCNHNHCLMIMLLICCLSATKVIT